MHESASRRPWNKPRHMLQGPGPTTPPRAVSPPADSDLSCTQAATSVHRRPTRLKDGATLTIVTFRPTVGLPKAVRARNGSQRNQTPPDVARPNQNVHAGQGLPVRLSPTVTDTLVPDTEEVTGSNPVRPTPFFENSSRVRAQMRASDLGFRRFVTGQSTPVCGQTRRLFPFHMFGAGSIELWRQSFRRRTISWPRCPEYTASPQPS
jgi:hypothetical protein